MATDLTVDTSAGPLSGRIAEPSDRARGLVVALHGGTYDSAYYDTGAGSLLDVAPRLGLAVVALDRPGYGAAAGLDPQWLTFERQAGLVVEAIGQVVARVRPEGGVVLVGHSIGGMVALTTAARGVPDLRGVEVSGIGARWNPGMLEMWSSFIGDVPAIEVPAEPHGQVMFGPAGTYAEAQLAADAGLIRPMAMPELKDVVQWADRFAGVAAAVTAPVSITFAEHDNIWAADDDARAAAAGLFGAAPSVRLDLVRGAGHCIELHRPGRGYVLGQLAFAESCWA